MILLIDNGGQTCNQLWIYASSLIHSIDTGERICVLTYDKEIIHFPNLVHSKHFSFPLYSRIMHKCFGIGTYVKIIRRIIRGKHHDFYPFLIWIFRGKVIKPWDNLYDLNHNDYYDKISTTFAFSKDIEEFVDPQILANAKDYDMIVGVHIRRGDYRFWKSGHYFYEMSQYRVICEQIRNLYPQQKIIFFLSTNEIINADEWKGVDYFVINKSSAMKDLYCLSKCDIIIGPPSSFSRWAAFIGKKKLCFILDNNQHNFIFKQVVSYSSFADGSPIWYEDKPSVCIYNNPSVKIDSNDNN